MSLRMLHVNCQVFRLHKPVRPLNKHMYACMHTCDGMAAFYVSIIVVFMYLWMDGWMGGWVGGSMNRCIFHGIDNNICDVCM